MFKNMRLIDVVAFCVGGVIGTKVIVVVLKKVLPL